MLVPIEYIQAQVRQALEEDVGDGDVTAQLLPEQQQATATVIAREAGILCGQQWFTEVFLQLDKSIRINWQAGDGASLNANQTVCTLSGPTRALLTGERTALNFLQTLSGTATITHKYVEAISDNKARLLDTRKTIPGLRLAQKYAVHCGGGSNHRIGLYDMILIKENHIASAGSVTAAMQQALAAAKRGMEIEIEVETLDQLQEAIAAGAKRILLDNFTLEQMRAAVGVTQSRARLEASGNITLENIHAVAATGVDFISIGAITKHVRALDLSMRIRVENSDS